MAKLEYQDETAPSLFRVGQGKGGAINVRIAGSVGVTPVDKSGTITAGGTAQQLAAADTNRKGFWIQNNSTSDLWVNTLATAVVGQPSMRLQPGDYYEAPTSGVSTGAISIIGATTGQAFSARVW